MILLIITKRQGIETLAAIAAASVFLPDIALILCTIAMIRSIIVWLCFFPNCLYKPNIDIAD